MERRPEWVFEPASPMGGATGNAFANILQAAGMLPEAGLAREAIQNSCDGDGTEGKTGPVEIRFREGPFARPLDEHRIETFAKVPLRLQSCAAGDSTAAIVRARIRALEHFNLAA